jgi:hypothetical protein
MLTSISAQVKEILQIMQSAGESCIHTSTTSARLGHRYFHENMILTGCQED